MMFPKPRKRINDAGHLTRIRALPCVCCGKHGPSEAHHLKKTVNRGMGMKASDEFVMPMCAEHHRGNTGVELFGNETKFFAQFSIYAPREMAELLYKHSKDYDMCFDIIMRRFR